MIRPVPRLFCSSTALAGEATEDRLGKGCPPFVPVEQDAMLRVDQNFYASQADESSKSQTAWTEHFPAIQSERDLSFGHRVGLAILLTQPTPMAGPSYLRR